MEFIPVEVYTNEIRTREPQEKDGLAHQETNSACDNDEVLSATSLSRTQYSRQPQINRMQHTAEVDILPMVTSKSAAFDSLCVVLEKGIFAGRHDGTLLHWKIQQTSSVTPLNVSKLYGHTGAVLAIEFDRSLGNDGLLFSGSADRSIKIWDPWRGSEAEQLVRGNQHDHFCVQTIPAHEASITSLRVISQQRSGLVSSSLDHTVKIWYPAEGRGLLLYPWFVAAQTITLSREVWPANICVRDSSMTSLFIGDSSGYISYFIRGASSSICNEGSQSNTRASEDSALLSNADRDVFSPKQRPLKLHNLGVVQLQMIADDSFVVSLGFDHTARVLDAITGTVSSTMVNRNPVRFTSCAWDSKSQSLFLVDAVGYLHIWDIVQDKWLNKLKLFPQGTHISCVYLPPMTDWMFVGIANCAKQWRINRDVGYRECSGHSDAVVAFAVLRQEVVDVPSDLYSAEDSNSVAVSSRFFSASLDNTLRCWDSYDMKAAFGFEERQSDITCMIASRKFAKVVTGHEHGGVKAWGIHTGQFVYAPQSSRSTITSIAMGTLRDQELVFAGDAESNLLIWELSLEGMVLMTSTCIRLANDRRDEITALLFCNGDYLVPRGGSEFIVVGYQTGDMAIWSLNKKVVLSRWKAHDDAISSITRHGCFVFSGSEDGAVRVWNCFHPSGVYELGVLRLPRSARLSSDNMSPTLPSIVAVDVLPQSGAILSAATDGTIQAWDYTGFDDTAGIDYDSYGKLLFHIKLEHEIRCMQYWPSQKAILCGTTQGRILVYQLPSHMFS